MTKIQQVPSPEEYSRQGLWWGDVLLSQNLAPLRVLSPRTLMALGLGGWNIYPWFTEARSELCLSSLLRSQLYNQLTHFHPTMSVLLGQGALVSRPRHP